MPSTYGNNGNRWWVGENLTDQNSFRWGNFFSNNAPSGYQSFPSGDAADDAAIVKAGVGGTVSLHNITWHIGGGPYPSQAAANAAIPGIQAASPAPGAVQQATSGSGLGAVGDFLTRLTSKSTWIRVAEVLLGTALIIISAAKLFAGTPAGRAATEIGMKAAIL